MAKSFGESANGTKTTTRKQSKLARAQQQDSKKTLCRTSCFVCGSWQLHSWSSFLFSVVLIQLSLRNLHNLLVDYSSTMAAFRSVTALGRMGAHSGWRAPIITTTSFQRRCIHLENESNNVINRFDLSGKVFVVTGGGRGLGLCMAEGLVEAGGIGR